MARSIVTSTLVLLSVVALCLVVSRPAHAEGSRDLKVCADPNNLPFSNARGEGFENRIVEVIAAELGTRVVYTWWPQRRGFLRNTLREGLCDLVPGVPSGLEMLATTRPYYRSGYVFVTRADRNLDLRSLDDPRPPLAMTFVEPRIDGPTLPMMFDISMGLRREDVSLKREIEAALTSRRPAIDQILAEYGIPRLDLAHGWQTSASPP